MKDIETDEDARAAMVVGALDALAELLGSTLPGVAIEVDRLAPLVAVIALQARAWNDCAPLSPKPTAANDWGMAQ
jgi:hypothetical protein